MATVRALRKDSVSLSSNVFEYFFCCFSGKRGNDQSSRRIRRCENETEDIADYGSNRDSERQQTTSRPVDGEDDTDLFDNEATRRNEKDNDDDDAGLDSSDALEPQSSTPVSFRPTRTNSKSPSRSNKSNASGADSSVIEAIRHSPSHDENFPEFPSSVSRRAGILQFSVNNETNFSSKRRNILPPKS